MIRRSGLGLTVLLLFLSLAPSYAEAQDSATQVGRSELWKVLEPKLFFTSDQIRSLFSPSPSPGITVSGQQVGVSIVLFGETFLARLNGSGAAAVLSFGNADRAYENSILKCYFESLCAANLTIGDNGNESASYTFSDLFGKYISSGSVTGTTQAQARVVSGSGTPRGFRTPFGSPAFDGGNCLLGPNSSSDLFPSRAEAKDYMDGRMRSMAVAWARAAPNCVNFDYFLAHAGDLGALSRASFLAMQRANVDPLKYFSIQGLEVIDDTNTEPDPTEPSVTTDPTDPTSTTDPTTTDPTTTDPPTDPTQEQDYEANCRIIDLFCWARWAFVPQVDWTAEWGELRQDMLTRAPFGYVGWLEEIGTMEGGSGLSTAFEYAGVQIDIAGSPFMQWWQGSAARDWITAVFFRGLFWLGAAGGSPMMADKIIAVFYSLMAGFIGVLPDVGSAPSWLQSGASLVGAANMFINVGAIGTLFTWMAGILGVFYLWRAVRTILPGG